MTEYGLFNDESADYTAEQAMEADIYSIEEAMEALAKYSPEDGLHVHEIEMADDEDDEDD